MSGYVIKQFRESNGFSQEDLARVLNVNRRTVSRWEQNSSKPNPDELKRLSTLIGVAEEEILSDKAPSILSSEEPGHMILNRISDGVDNLVTGQETINESIVNSHDEYRRKQDELIEELRSQNRALGEKIDSYEKNNNVQNELLRQKRIRNVILFVFLLILTAIICAVIWMYMAYGPNANGVYADQPVVVKTE